MRHPSGGAPPRPPLDAAALNASLVRPGGLWREIRVTAETGSTNADLLREARAGAAEGLVLVAETQTAGRGRLGRSWSSPPRAALACSVLLRPVAVPPAARAWLPLLTGIAVAAALRAEAGVAAGLKWPNDVLVADRKIAGILAEAHGDAIVVGIGLNVTLTAAELPVPGATSLLLEGAACLDRGAAAGGRAHRAGRPVRDLGRRPWPRAGPGAGGLRAEYLRWCVTVGREIRVELPAGPPLTGTAADVDETGRLAVRTGSGTTLVGAGDVVHVR